MEHGLVQPLSSLRLCVFRRCCSWQGTRILPRRWCALLPSRTVSEWAESSVLMKWLGTVLIMNLAADCQAALQALRASSLQAGLALASCCYLGLLPLAEIASIVDDAVCAINSSSPDPPRPGFNSAVIVCTIEMYL